MCSYSFAEGDGTGKNLIFEIQLIGKSATLLTKQARCMRLINN